VLALTGLEWSLNADDRAGRVFEAARVEINSFLSWTFEEFRNKEKKVF
jgi:hypothetical protein